MSMSWITVDPSVIFELQNVPENKRFSFVFGNNQISDKEVDGYIRKGSHYYRAGFEYEILDQQKTRQVALID